MVTNEYLSWRRRRRVPTGPLADGFDPAGPLQPGHDDALWNLLAALPRQQRAVLIEARTLPDVDWPRWKKDLYHPVAKVNGQPAYQVRHKVTGTAGLRTIAENLTIANCQDRSTWSPLG